MSNASPHGNISLIGFMGSGKSSIGRRVAWKMKMKLVDTDRLVVEMAGGKSIADIFRDHGEAHFRDLESYALKSLVGQQGLVIATGGGIVTRAANSALFRELGFTMWLTADEDTIFERVSRNKNRPLVQTENPRKTVTDLLAKRLPLYARVADASVDSTGLHHHQVVQQVVDYAQSFFAKPPTDTH